ncbi:MAG: hypothetical protein QG594_359 [Bacteroidota bacterium]|nr:hypothetical protein [Bacteroidota bacterium]
MRNRHKFTFIGCCIFADFSAIVLVVLLFLSWSNNALITFDYIFGNRIIPVAILSWLFSVAYFPVYKVTSLFDLQAFYRNSWKAFFVQSILFQFFIFVFRTELNYFFLSDANLFQLTIMLFYFLLSRVVFTFFLIRLKRWVLKPYSIAIWGFNKTSIDLAAKIENRSYFIDFRGILNEDDQTVYSNKVEYNAAIINAINQAFEAGINELYIVTNPDFLSNLKSYFELGDKYCMRLKFIPNLATSSRFHYSSNDFENLHVIKPRYEPLQDAYNRLMKRVFDILFSLFIIVVVLSWLYPILAFLIKRESKGPVLFKQMRTGKKNKPFWCYKFRSMTVNDKSDSQQAQKNDVRVTKIGKILRKTSLDELPQFFNVLGGSMSVVGPRPHMLKHTEDYNDQIDNFMVRHFVKPGITGLAQITGFRGETKRVLDMKRRVNADIEYVQKWSLIYDMQICFMTVVIALKGDDNAF